MSAHPALFETSPVPHADQDALTAGFVRAALVDPAALVAGAPEGQALAVAWADLCADLVEENPFFEPWALTPALRIYGGASVRLACVWSGDQLIGLAPVVPRRFYARMPMRYWQVWAHPHCFFAAPLVRTDCEEAFFSALYALLGEGDDRRCFLRMGRLDRDGAIAVAARGQAARDGRFSYDAGAAVRAVLFAGASAEATIAVHVRKKKRKEMQRLRNRLEELGEVRVRQLKDGDDLGAWTQSFLGLEDKSWKGAHGTSLKARAGDADWFAETLAGAHALGKLHFLRLDLDGLPLAMLVSFISRGAGYSLKICHDSDYARFSPGVMIELEAMRVLLDDPDFRFADSCAAPDHSMINGLWRARRTITGVNVSGAGLMSRMGLRSCRMVEGARAKIPLKVNA